MGIPQNVWDQQDKRVAEYQKLPEKSRQKMHFVHYLNRKCDNCKQPEFGGNFEKYRCENCKIVWYCSEKCQSESDHKAKCT